MKACNDVVLKLTFYSQAWGNKELEFTLLASKTNLKDIMNEVDEISCKGHENFFPDKWGNVTFIMIEKNVYCF